MWIDALYNPTHLGCSPKTGPLDASRLHRRTTWKGMAIMDTVTTTINGKPWNHWIGLRENLQETMVFTIKYRAFL
jgi:hypothetical protein